MLVLRFLICLWTLDVSYSLLLLCSSVCSLCAIVPMASPLKVLFGSTMHLLVNQIMPGTPQENTTELWRLIRVEYAAEKTPTRFGSLKYSMFNPKGGPLFRGSSKPYKI